MMDDQPEQPIGNPLITAGLMTLIFGWGIGGTAMWWMTGKEDWLLGWIITLIILMAG